MGQGRARGLCEHFHRDVGRGPGSHRTVAGGLARFRRRDHVRQAAPARIGTGDDDIRDRGQQGHAVERVLGGVAQLDAQVLVDGQRGVARDQQRSAVRRCAGHGTGRDRRARAGAVLHHDRTLQALGHALRHPASQEVGGAARGVGNDHRDRTRRQHLGTRRQGGRGTGNPQREGRQRPQASNTELHRYRPCLGGSPSGRAPGGQCRQFGRGWLSTC